MAPINLNAGAGLPKSAAFSLRIFSSAGPESSTCRQIAQLYNGVEKERNSES